MNRRQAVTTGLAALATTAVPCAAWGVWSASIEHEDIGSPHGVESSFPFGYRERIAGTKPWRYMLQWWDDDYDRKTLRACLFDDISGSLPLSDIVISVNEDGTKAWSTEPLIRIVELRIVEDYRGIDILA